MVLRTVQQRPKNGVKVVTNELVSTRPSHCAWLTEDTRAVFQKNRPVDNAGTAQFVSIVCIIVDMKFGCPNAVSSIVQDKKGVVNRASQEKRRGVKQRVLAVQLHG